MCGICCSLTLYSRDVTSQRKIDKPQVSTRNPIKTTDTKSHKLLSSRGPNFSGQVTVSTETYEADLSSHVLWTQGPSLAEQPLVFCERKSLILCFNGDIYSFEGRPLECSQENDGEHLFGLIQSCKDDGELSCLFSTLEGPFAFILLDVNGDKLWFGRDVFGRSNLLLGLGVDLRFDVDLSLGVKSLFISSVAPFSHDETTVEIPSAGIYCLNLRSCELKLYPWSCLERRIAVRDSLKQFLNFMEVKLNVTTTYMSSSPIHPSVNCELKALPSDTNQDDFLNKLRSVASLDLPDERSLMEVTALLKSQILELISVLRESVRKRVKTKPPFCKTCLPLSSARFPDRCTHSKVSVLFSGGLDSTVLAYLVCELLTEGESVDLINVAFANDYNSDFNVPDRITGIQSFKALKSIFSDKGIKINFVEVNVIKSEVTDVRQKIITDLVSPLQSVLDDSIGCCLWFAARGKGILGTLNNGILPQFATRESPEEITTMELSQEYQSPARVIFVGSGADELLGGYSRHRSAYENGSWEGLRNEMQEDIDRISIRNIGRDNRVLSSHGVCPRMPFLDENVVKYLTQDCDLWAKCCPMFPRGLGEKILLRGVALELFGQEHIKLALFPKRAMQFGSRIAKLENSKEKGGDVCKRLRNEF